MNVDTAAKLIPRLTYKFAREMCRSMGLISTGRVSELRQRLHKLLMKGTRNAELLNILQNFIDNESQYETPMTITRTQPHVPALTRRGRRRKVTIANPEVVPDPSESVVEVEGTSADIPPHPDVRFKPLPFYEVLAELIKPTTIDSRGPNLSERSFHFHLTPQQAFLIKSERNADVYDVQVQVRVGLLETTSAQDDAYPPGLMIWVNKEVFPVPSSSPNMVLVGGHRNCQPLNITTYIYVNPVKPNEVRVSTKPHFQRFVLAAYLVRKHSWAGLLQRMRSKGLRVDFYTKGLIQQKMKDDADEIATTCLRVSLVCPLGKMRMTTPCRATTCEHVQCFDASTYLQMNEKKTRWLCPVCDKPALFENLFIDEYFVKVLTSHALPSECTEIELRADGDWRPRRDAPSTSTSSAFSQQPKGKPEINVHISDDECEIVVEKVEEPKPPRRSRSPHIESIDLVSSSDESANEDLGKPFKKRRIHLGETRQPTSPHPLPQVIELGSDSEPEVAAKSSATSVSSLMSSPPRRRRKQRFPTYSLRRRPRRISSSAELSSSLSSSSDSPDSSSEDDHEESTEMADGPSTSHWNPGSSSEANHADSEEACTSSSGPVDQLAASAILPSYPLDLSQATSQLATNADAPCSTTQETPENETQLVHDILNQLLESIITEKSDNWNEHSYDGPDQEIQEIEENKPYSTVDGEISQLAQKAYEELQSFEIECALSPVENGDKKKRKEVILDMAVEDQNIEQLNLHCDEDGDSIVQDCDSNTTEVVPIFQTEQELDSHLPNEASHLKDTPSVAASSSRLWCDPHGYIAADSTQAVGTFDSPYYPKACFTLPHQLHPEFIMQDEENPNHARFNAKCSKNFVPAILRKPLKRSPGPSTSRNK